MAIVAHPSRLVHQMVVVHLYLVMRMGHAHVVAATRQQTLCAKNVTAFRVETLRLSKYSPINLYT